MKSTDLFELSTDHAPFSQSSSRRRGRGKSSTRRRGFFGQSRATTRRRRPISAQEDSPSANEKSLRFGFDQSIAGLFSARKNRSQPGWIIVYFVSSPWLGLRPPEVPTKIFLKKCLSYVTLIYLCHSLVTISLVWKVKQLSCFFIIKSVVIYLCRYLQCL